MSGYVGGVDKVWTVDGCSGDDVAPPNINPEPRALSEVSLAEAFGGETAEFGKDLGDSWG